MSAGEQPDTRRQEALITLLLHGEAVARLWDSGAYGTALAAGGADIDAVLQDLLLNLIGEQAGESGR
ncbi:hypothetical protein [Acidisphaera rubrifaciens]|uniref:Uncharacterized protein n=1 Tax=Acidisphaera rubrifaciens HS-AP3 TaxID=1231350 RepID=A0A0D6P3Z5_9PROT|nr:hypothetical protein [Acidisphaera rubrifaciens]GAN76377.1 hypothetical protein Asru_0087_06 [Acidisphaera rubrifaciens HS-AP3]